MNKRMRELLVEAGFMFGRDSYGEFIDIPGYEGNTITIMDNFIELLFDAVGDTIVSCDESPKAIIHEPYRTVLDEMTKLFFDEENDVQTEDDVI